MSLLWKIAQNGSNGWRLRHRFGHRASRGLGMSPAHPDPIETPTVNDWFQEIFVVNLFGLLL